jgi:predicted RNA-binding protein YlxR (DUF448 family)
LQLRPECGPIRTCLGCRTRRPISELVRLALTPGRDRPMVVMDPGHRLPGRGAWICSGASGCLAKALVKGRLGKALRVTDPDLSNLKPD